MKNLIRTILLFPIVFSMALSAHAGESSIPLIKGVRMASDDLLYQGNPLSSREAQDFSTMKNIDISVLQPKENDIWGKEEVVIDDQAAIDLQENDTLTYEGKISSAGMYRFNAIPDNSSKIYTIHLDKALHTLLLRKNLLRKLGYKIPAIKYLRKLTIRFNSPEELDRFLKKEITEDASGAATRWVKKIDGLVIQLQDVAVTEPSETDFYNAAVGVPTQTINSRTIRGLVIPYSLADLYESINKLSWIDGKIDNRAAVLSHFTENDFATTIEDAQWMLRKLNQLSREDFKAIVIGSYFPKEVALVLVEKLISRRNSLNRLFSEKAEALTFDPKISSGEMLKDGKLLQKDFPEYASRFAYGDAESPFEQLRYFLYSKIQSNAIDNLVTKFNKYLEAYDITAARGKFFQKQFEDGLAHFLATGEIQPIGVQTWTSPFFNAHLIFSRDIVLGNYLGTDNLVQLADTFGASVDLGIYVGVEGLGNGLSGSVKSSTSLVRTFSHVKPVLNLKQSLKEPYKNIFVNLLKKSLKENYFSLAELKNAAGTNDEKAKKIQELLKEIELTLNTGESIIMTDRFMPTTEVTLNFSTGLIGAGIGAGSGVTTIKRIHIYKKSAKVLQIYDDSGFVKDINLSFSLNEYISLLKVTGKVDNGNYKIKSYMVNLSSDLDTNPNFYANALSVYNVLKNKDFELLDSNVTPVNLNAGFKDRSLNFSLLFWKMRSIKGKTYFNLKTKDGINGNYFSYTKDFLNGVNVETFSKQMANYYLAEKSNGAVAISVDGTTNPGDSFFGRSTTQNIRFEAEVNEDKRFERKFLSLSDTKQGWALSADKLKKMMGKVNDKFQAVLFDVGQIDFEKLRLFRVGYHINLYDRGIERLNAIKTSEIEALESRYKSQRTCRYGEDRSTNTAECGDLGAIKYDIQKCLKSKSDEDTATCNVGLVEDMLAYLDFKDFKQLIGENNLYVYGTMDGFRQHSEILNDTVFSNTVGKIGSNDWNGPLDVVRELLGLSGGEFSGAWFRESL